MIYLTVITLGLCFMYVFLLAVSPVLLHTKSSIRSASIQSVIAIFCLSYIGYYITYHISDPDIANRFLHSFGGGFLAFLVCFLAYRDGKWQLNKLQFFVGAALLVTSLGVVNEITEFCLQNFAGLTYYATSINDTWLDLISNTVGLCIAAIVLVPCVNRKKM